MSSFIADGTGSGTLGQVYSDNKFATRSVNSSEIEDASKDGRAWNFNTGWISTVSADSALIYFYNDELQDFFIDNIAVGLKESSATEVQGVYLVSNPTGGTLVGAATEVSMKQNRRIGSGNALSTGTLVYKATASGQTLTGGSDMALFAQNDGGRLFATANIVVPRGQAFGIRLEVLGSFSDDVYAAIIGHVSKDL